MNTPQLVGAAVYILVAIIGIAITGVYGYHAWTDPEKLRRTALRNLESGMFRWWPFREASKQWIGTPSYLWIVRIGAALVLIAFAAMIVLTILAITGVL
jgi:hypothetical protein